MCVCMYAFLYVYACISRRPSSRVHKVAVNWIRRWRCHLLPLAVGRSVSGPDDLRDQNNHTANAVPARIRRPVFWIPTRPVCLNRAPRCAVAVGMVGCAWPQVVWRDSLEVACVKCQRASGGGYCTFCMYNPPGNIWDTSYFLANVPRRLFSPSASTCLFRMVRGWASPKPKGTPAVFQLPASFLPRNPSPLPHRRFFFVRPKRVTDFWLLRVQKWAKNRQDWVGFMLARANFGSNNRFIA